MGCGAVHLTRKPQQMHARSLDLAKKCLGANHPWPLWLCWTRHRAVSTLQPRSSLRLYRRRRPALVRGSLAGDEAIYMPRQLASPGLTLVAGHRQYNLSIIGSTRKPSSRSTRARALPAPAQDAHDHANQLRQALWAPTSLCRRARARASLCRRAREWALFTHPDVQLLPSAFTCSKPFSHTGRAPAFSSRRSKGTASDRSLLVGFIRDQSVHRTPAAHRRFDQKPRRQQQWRQQQWRRLQWRQQQ